MTLTVSEKAAAQLLTIVNAQASAEQGVRLIAQAGGGCACSGGSFAMGLDEATEDDAVLEVAGVRFIIDPDTAPKLEGATIDYVEEVMRQGFSIEAPNAGGGGGCACGGH